ncbi:hypothetical protein [Rhodosalinus sp. FB01]|uniref:hypothetical protein n=1 Tax=Rhodosalinus sp. FB01 TaxID=3239194 RepID=UPI003524786D
MKVTRSDALTKIRLQAASDDSTVDLDLTTREVDQLIGELAEMRAKMAPAHTGRISDETAAPFQADNLLWETFPDRALRGVVLALNHAGLGWIALRLSRAQIEDLVTSFEFSLAKLMIARQAAETADDKTA